MNKLNDPVQIFMAAVANELHRDEQIHRRFKMNRYGMVVIPRLEKIAIFAQRYPKLLAFVASVSSRLWLPLLYPIYLLSQTVIALIFTSNRSPSESKEVFFVNSVTSLICSKNINYHGEYIYTSNSLKALMGSNVSLGCIREYISLYNIFTAIKYSIHCMYLIPKTIHTPGASFQIYAAFDWFLVWNSLHKVIQNADTVWINSDSDRWAVLLDRYPTKAKKNIVQHGLLSDGAGYAGSRSAMPLPTKLQNIDIIHLLSEESEFCYRDLVISENSETKYTNNLNGVIQFSPVDSDCGKQRILIIGQHENVDSECNLANHLIDNYPETLVFLRPHPGSRSTRYKQLLPKTVQFVDDMHCYPYAEICICFNYSTLAYLYEKQGAKIIYLIGLQGKEIAFVDKCFHENASSACDLEYVNLSAN
jgi:hypothetical protein